MTDILTPLAPAIQSKDSKARASSMDDRPALNSLAPTSEHARMRSGHLNLNTYSVVDQNGSFAFDRVLKAGDVHKRTRKTKQWKPFHLVLRPNLLSLYRDSSESRLLKQVSLSDVTAVAYLKDPKGRREHIFGVFSPARNFHLEAKTEKDAAEWVELIRQEARVDEEAQVNEMLLQSPTAATHEGPREQQDRLASSSPEPFELTTKHTATTRDGVKIPGIRRPSGPSLDYSGDETGGAYASDFSDMTNPPTGDHPTSPYGSFATRNQRLSSLQPGLQPGSQIQRPSEQQQQQQQPPPAPQASASNPRPKSQNARNASYSSLPPDATLESSERTIWSGHLLALRTNRAGVRSWKKLWVVLRPKNLAFYKNEDEYAAKLILPLSNVIDAVEIDPLSRSKNFCLQVITEEKGYRFCAKNEDALAEWLGAIKMQLSRRREGKA